MPRPSACRVLGTLAVFTLALLTAQSRADMPQQDQGLAPLGGRTGHSGFGPAGPVSFPGCEAQAGAGLLCSPLSVRCTAGLHHRHPPLGWGWSTPAAQSPHPAKPWHLLGYDLQGQRKALAGRAGEPGGRSLCALPRLLWISGGQAPGGSKDLG